MTRHGVKHIIAALLVTTIISTSDMDAAMQSSAAQPGASVGRTAQERAVDGLIFHSLPSWFRLNREGLERRLGKPIAVSSRPFPNPYTSKTDQIVTVTFTGLQVVLYQNTATAEDAPIAVEVSDKRFGFPAMLKIGSSRQQVERLLGKPTHQESSQTSYTCIDCTEVNKIMFTFLDDKVTSIRWEFNID